MDRYTIYCTSEQTKKAIELGALILHGTDSKEDAFTHLPTGVIMDKGNIFFIPTAEQLIGWLEERKDILFVIEKLYKTWRFGVFYKNYWKLGGKFYSRKEATLAAIDATLEYLTNNK